jgi:hypothetical protein
MVPGMFNLIGLKNRILFKKVVFNYQWCPLDLQLRKQQQQRAQVALQYHLND